MTFSTQDSVIIPHEKNHGAMLSLPPIRNPPPHMLYMPFPETNKHAHTRRRTHTHAHTLSCRTINILPCSVLQWAMGILMIITAIITFMIQDISLARDCI